MHADRLRLLADHLEKNVKDEKFKIDHWKCGSVCCAVGHAGDVSEFQELGFRIETLRSLGGLNGVPTLEDDVYTYDEWDAVMKLFGVTWKQSQWLFSGRYYPSKWSTTRKEVIERLRFLADNPHAELKLKMYS